MEADRVNAIRYDDEKKGAKKAIYREQRGVLQQQIADKQQELEELKLQKEADKRLIEEIVGKIISGTLYEPLKFISVPLTVKLITLLRICCLISPYSLFHKISYLYNSFGTVYDSLKYGLARLKETKTKFTLNAPKIFCCN